MNRARSRRATSLPNVIVVTVTLQRVRARTCIPVKAFARPIWWFFRDSYVRIEAETIGVATISIFNAVEDNMRQRR
jgi:hypothetical protein